MKAYCLECGYDISHGRSDSCPECGQPFRLDQPRTFVLTGFRWPRLIVTVVCFQLIVLAVQLLEVGFYPIRQKNIKVAQFELDGALEWSVEGINLLEIDEAALSRESWAFGIMGPIGCQTFLLLVGMSGLKRQVHKRGRRPAEFVIAGMAAFSLVVAVWFFYYQVITTTP